MADAGRPHSGCGGQVRITGLTRSSPHDVLEMPRLAAIQRKREVADGATVQRPALQRVGLPVDLRALDATALGRVEVNGEQDDPWAHPETAGTEDVLRQSALRHTRRQIHVDAQRLRFRRAGAWLYVNAVIE